MPTPTFSPAPTAALSPTSSSSTPVATADQDLLEVMDETRHWVAYRSPTGHALSMTWAGDVLWLADLFTGVFYKTVVTEEGLRIAETIQVKRDPFMQARDLAWDGRNLWSVHWGDLVRHQASELGLFPDVWISEGEIGSPNLHHMKAIAWDGKRLWSGLDGTLYRHEVGEFTATEGQQRPSIEETFGLPSSPVSMSFRGSELWIANRKHGFVYRLDASSPTPGAGLPVLGKYSIVQQPFGLAWSQENLWLYDWYTNLIYKVKELPATSLDPEDDFLEAGQGYTEPEQIAGDVTWPASRSPYLVRGGFVVPGGSTLTIEPGVKVFIQDGDFRVEGVLKAEGDPGRMITFSHSTWEGEWGNFIFAGGQASRSVLKYVKVQYSDNGVNLESSTPRIEHSVIRKSGIYGIRARLEAGDYEALELVGNHITQVAGVSIKIVLSPEARLPHITVRENEVSYAYAAGVIIESTGEDLVEPPGVLVEHNVFESGYRGSGGGFPGVGNVTYRHNLLRNGISGGGVQVLHPNSMITHNLMEYTLEDAFQLSSARPDLRAMRGPGNAVFRYNTVRHGGLQSNMGDSTTVVEHNNFIPGPQQEYWAWGMDRASGQQAGMPHNWWGTADLDEIRSHIIDANLGEGYARDYSALSIEPVLPGPNGVGFVRGVVTDGTTGEPVSEALVEVGDVALRSNVVGGFFTATKEGVQRLALSAPGYTQAEVEVMVTAAEASFLEVILEPERG